MHVKIGLGKIPHGDFKCLLIPVSHIVKSVAPKAAFGYPTKRAAHHPRQRPSSSVSHVEVFSWGVSHGTIVSNIPNDPLVIVLVITLPRWGSVNAPRYPAVPVNFGQIEKLVVNQDDRVP